MDKSLLYRYSTKEDVFNAISHGIGVIFGLYALTWLCYLSDNLTEYFVSIFYGFTLIFMFLSSTLYHAIFHDGTRAIFKRLDHSAIYLLITGSYAPYTFLILNTTLAYVTFIILITLTIIGIIIKVFYVGKFKKTSTLIYVLMGWLVVFQIPDLLATDEIVSLTFLALGGVVYTVGAVFYAFAKFNYHHFIWHIFVFVAAVLQYYAIYLVY